MSKISTLICKILPFPVNVGPHLVAKQPEHFEAFVYNDSIAPSAFDTHNPAKLSVDIATQILVMKNPNMIKAWCSSRDKRQGPCDLVMRHWSLDSQTQLAFASKPLTEDSARQVLDSNSFVDSSKLVAAARASYHAIWSWLKREPVGLSDDEWVSAFELAASKSITPLGDDVQATLHQRPHLAQRLLDSEDDGVATAACAAVPWVDAAAALTRIKSIKGPRFKSEALCLLLDHPSLPTAVREDGFAYATEQKLLVELYRYGCPSPGSALAVGVPLNELTDPLMVELISSRPIAQHPARMHQMAQMCGSAAAGVQLLERFSELPHRVGNFLPSLARGPLALAHRCSVMAVGHPLRDMQNEMQSRKERLETQTAIAALTEPVQTTEPYGYMRRQRRYYGGNGTVLPTVDDLLDAPLGELAGLIGGYSAHEDAASLLTGALTERLGDGSTDESLSKWEQFIMLLSKTGDTVKIRQVATSAARLG
jgi:hypothetical protein